jgi:hypothetical protein
MPVVIRGVFDGKVARPLPGEPVPPIEGEVEVEIVLPLLEDMKEGDPVEGLFRIRSETPQLPFSVADLLKLSREYEENCD